MLWLIYKILTRQPGPGLGCHTGRSFCFCEINIVSPAAGGRVVAPHRHASLNGKTSLECCCH